MSSIDELARILFEYQRLHQPLEKSDLIFLTGSADLRVAQKAAQLFFDGYAPLILVAGGYGKIINDPNKPTESDRFVKTLLETGISDKYILIENQSSNTVENIFYAKKIFTQKNIQPKSIIVVCKTYVERRFWATFSFHFPGIKITVASPNTEFVDVPDQMVNKDKFINLMVGDIQRMILYAGKSLIPQEIPQSVMSAYQQLVDCGYTEQLFDPNNLPQPNFGK